MTDDGDVDYHPEENNPPDGYDTGPGNPMSRLEQELAAILGTQEDVFAEPPSSPDPGAEALGEGHHRHLPPGTPHVPPYMFIRMQLSRTTKFPEDYANAMHHMFNYLAALNGIPEDSFEICGTVFEEPEFGFDFLFAVCLVNCDHTTFPMEDLDKWLDFFFPVAPSDGTPLEDE